MRLLLDEHVPPQIAVRLRLQGHNVIAVAERRDLLGAADHALWEAARGEHRMVVTQDVGDFMRLALRDAAIGKEHPGLVLLHRRWFSRGTRDIGQTVVSLGALLTANPAANPAAGRIIWLEAADQGS